MVLKSIYGSAPAGTGITAGGPIRPCEVLGIQDVVAKSSPASPHNVLKVYKWIKTKTPKILSAIREKKYRHYFKREGN